MPIAMKNILTDEQFKEEYDALVSQLKQKKFNNSCVVFVYNSLDSIDASDLHISECIYDDELALIKDSLHLSPDFKLYLVDGEDKFINLCPNLRKNFNQIYVYSMAQNLPSIGRRCLIPLLCEYYSFTNISSDARSSFLGGDKMIMHAILNSVVPQPKRVFLSKPNINAIKEFMRKHEAVMLKPICESASIGVSNLFIKDDVVDAVICAINKYKRIMLEEFILGDEVECTVLPWQGSLYVAKPIKIIKSSDYLDYKTVQNDNYDFEFYMSNAAELVRQLALRAYRTLGFNSIARFDFIVKQSQPFLFDITPNPTISACSSANISTRFLEDERAIYRALLLDKLFVPAFN